MFPRLLLVSILLLLGACQSPRIERDFDTSRDFAAYRSWSWQEPALQYRPDDPRLRSDLTEQRIRSAIEQQLEQRGLRPAQPGNPGDLRVQAWLIVDQRQEQVSSHYGGYWGGYWDGGWGGPAYSETLAPSTTRWRRCRSICSTLLRRQAGLAGQCRTGAARFGAEPGAARSGDPQHCCPGPPTTLHTEPR